MTQPPIAVPVEVTSSYAWRAGDDIEVQLHLPEPPPIGDGTRIRWRSGKRIVHSGLTVREHGSGVLLRSTLPAQSVDGAVCGR
ncbi:MAG: hypothetical protein ABI873_18890, partial [Marmoricola sp.]